MCSLSMQESHINTRGCGRLRHALRRPRQELLNYNRYLLVQSYITCEGIGLDEELYVNCSPREFANDHRRQE